MTVEWLQEILTGTEEIAEKVKRDGKEDDWLAGEVCLSHIKLAALCRFALDAVHTLQQIREESKRNGTLRRADWMASVCLHRHGLEKGSDSSDSGAATTSPEGE